MRGSMVWTRANVLTTETQRHREVRERPGTRLRNCGNLVYTSTVIVTRLVSVGWGERGEEKGGGGGQDVVKILPRWSYEISQKSGGVGRVDLRFCSCVSAGVNVPSLTKRWMGFGKVRWGGKMR